MCEPDHCSPREHRIYVRPDTSQNEWTIPGEIVMPERAAQQGHAAILGRCPLSSGPASPKARASSRSTLSSSKSSMLGVGVAGVLVTVAAVAAGVMMMTGSDPAPVTTQVAALSAPSA